MIDEVLNTVQELNYICESQKLGIDAYKCFRAFEYCNKYNGIKELYKNWDKSLCQVNQTIESKIEYFKPYEEFKSWTEQY